MRPSQLTSEQSDWWKDITSVCGNNLGLVQIKAIGKCLHLKWASFTSNHLQHLDGLDECGELTELHVDHNWLRKIDSRSHASPLQAIVCTYVCVYMSYVPTYVRTYVHMYVVLCM